MNDNYISGLSFYKIANWSLCPRYPINIEPNNFKENDIVFLNFDYFDNFIDILNKISHIKKFILVIHNSDKFFTKNHYELLKDFTTKIYAINCIYTNEYITNIPIGFRDMPINTIPIIKNIQQFNIKDILIYMNFEINTNIIKRTECYNYFINFNWVTYKSKLNIQDFYNNIERSKYILSPEGTGIDCHRIYESIYFDAIPIIKSSLMDKFYKKLPIIIVENWSEITENYLISNYDIFYNRLKLWKIKNYNWLDPLFWIN